MPTDDQFIGLIDYLKTRYFKGVPDLPKTKDEWLVFLRTEGAWLLHHHADKIAKVSQTNPQADPVLRMHLQGRSNAMRALGDLLKATVVSENDLQPDEEDNEGPERRGPGGDDYDDGEWEPHPGPGGGRWPPR